MAPHAEVPFVPDYVSSAATGLEHHGQQTVGLTQPNGQDYMSNPWSDFFYDHSALTLTNPHLLQGRSDSTVFDAVQPNCFFTGNQSGIAKQSSHVRHNDAALTESKHESSQRNKDGYDGPIISQPYQPFDLSESLLASSFEYYPGNGQSFHDQAEYVGFEQQQQQQQQSRPFQPCSLQTSTQGVQSASLPLLPYQQQFRSGLQQDSGNAHDFLKSEPDTTYPPLPAIASDEDLETFLMSSLAEYHNPQLLVSEPPSALDDMQATGVNSFGYHESIPSVWGGILPTHQHARHASPFVSRKNSQARYTGGFIRDAAKDQMLLRLRDQGMSYKEIKEHLNMPEAESTLRGRFRTMTKPRAERVRKPAWGDRDVRILKEAVSHFLRNNSSNDVAAPTHGRRQHPKHQDPLNRVPWKHVADYMKRRGCYRYGNSTVKKKYYEVMREQAIRATASSAL